MLKYKTENNTRRTAAQERFVFNYINIYLILFSNIYVYWINTFAYVGYT